MVIVWRLRGNIIRTFLYWQRATSSMGTVNRNSSHSPVGPWVCVCVFWVAWFIFMFMCVLFYLGQLSHFLSCFGAGVTNLNEPLSSFLLPPHYCGLGAGSIPFRAIVNNGQCEMRGLFMSLVIHYWIGDVQDWQGVSASEMTYIVSSGALNSTHSPPGLLYVKYVRVRKMAFDQPLTEYRFEQGDHLSGKPGNLKPVREMSGNLRTVREFSGNKLCYGKGTKNWLLLVAYLHSYRYLVASSNTGMLRVPLNVGKSAAYCQGNDREFCSVWRVVTLFEVFSKILLILWL